jgi:wobble nucleotide-excising tRNase
MKLLINRPNFEDHFNDLKILVEKKITLSETLQELVTDSLLQDWADKGRRYHREKKLNKCAFCGGIIDPERWEKLDAHFSKESEELKKSIENKKSMLEASLRQIENFLTAKEIVKENYYSMFHDEFDTAKNKWDGAVNNYRNLIEEMLEGLQKRYDDIFNPKTIDNLTDNSNDIVDSIELFNQLSRKNNEKSTSLSDDKNDSRKLLRYSETARFFSEIEYEEETKTINNDKEKLIQPEKNIEKLEKTIACLNEERKQEELKLNDEGEAARKINNHLLNFFGHDGLSLEPEIVQNDSPKTKFVIKRANEKALNLSEGECSLISFCYFIAKMEDELNSPNNDQLIIYIDDPISSLDSNHIFFMFSLIESVIAKEEKYNQLFISTHNLDFLKYIKRLTIPHGERNKELISHFIIEKRRKDIEYRCFLFKMPSYLKDYVTEYNFLFKEIYNIARPFENGDRSRYFENNFTLLYNLPNNMRRFLECYLFYRYPNTDSPLSNLGKIFQGNIPALVNRVINEYSHLTWGDRGTLVMDVAEAETVAKEIIKAIMGDEDHFEALCDSIGVDKNIVLS